ncbi:MAG: ATP-dependent DNA helicase RecG [Desulfobacteraceae bacterium]|nr:MAG: ATP-dependent DNA helicase RecG [Desulfobacteraceae bacterium]
MSDTVIRKKNTNLALPLSLLKGIGPKRAAFFAQKGLYTILDLLLFTPIRYEDRTRIVSLAQAVEGAGSLVRGQVISGRESFFPRTRKRLFRILLKDGNQNLELLWFQYKKQHLEQYVQKGLNLLVYGTVRQNRGSWQMIHPDIVSAGEEDTPLGFFPVYSHIPGISVQVLRKIMRQALEQYQHELVDPLPAELVQKLELPGLNATTQCLHFPDHSFSIDDLNQFRTPYHRRLIFERFFWVMLTLAFRKINRQKQGGRVFQIPTEALSGLEKQLPFKLTADQIKVIEEIMADLKSTRPMNRLVLGDVGCGKTVVAAAAAHLAIRNHVQTALMAPTQILAQQHFEYFSGLNSELGFKPVLLTSQLKKAERDELYEQIKQGAFNLIIGTHALIQKGLSFLELGLVIIDEQHRFGVRARALLDRKGQNPHILVMSATPIPRTLAMTVYGDLDISMIREFPAGRTRRTTCLALAKDKVTVFEKLKEKLSAGQQAFVICPMIEQSEESDLKNVTEMEVKLKKLLSPPYRIGLVHGQLEAEERENAMAQFRQGKLDLLTATTVIEVGIHVPNATIMIIEQAERFGLAQLHQLRGRIGRGQKEGICFLMASAKLTDKARERLQVLTETEDGFVIAQKDLELRGQGELIGMQQAGIGELDLNEILQESGLLEKAKQETEDLVQADPDLSQPEHAALREYVESILMRPLD